MDKGPYNHESSLVIRLSCTFSAIFKIIKNNCIVSKCIGMYMNTSEKLCKYIYKKMTLVVLVKCIALLKCFFST